MGMARTVIISNQRYHLQNTKVFLPGPVYRHFNFDPHSLFIPITAIAWNKAVFDVEDLDATSERYAQADDVWCQNFLPSVLILLSTKKQCEIRTKHTVCIHDALRKLPEGPLLVERPTGQVFRVAKLVHDINLAFVSAILPTAKTRSAFEEFPEQARIEVALPSRLYYKQSQDKPLAGVRIGVKDSIALKGLRTGFGNRAWREHYDAESTTAPCIQRVLDAGAIVVGKLVSSEFAEGVEASEWADGVCPFNPRGDGQQKPSSSSTGSAVAVAAYDWLDAAIGTDTGGSIRHPAGVNGIFGQRPTAGSVDLNGVLGATDLFNTVGIFARSVEIFSTVGSYLVGAGLPSYPMPKERKYNLLYPTRTGSKKDSHFSNQHRWFPHPETDSLDWTQAEKQMEVVVSQMEKHFDCQRIPFNIYELWAATPPKGQPRSLDQATGQIYGDITTSSACATGIDRFIAEYMETNGGKQPPISDIVKQRLDYGRKLPEEKIAAALQATAAFKRWAGETLFGSYDQDATTVMIFPQSCGRPEYRDDESRWDGNLFIEIFSIYAFGYLCGCPDYTIPISEVPYLSRVTHQTEYLPVSLSLLGKPGTDRELFALVQSLYKAGIVTDVMAGNRLYPDRTIDT